jgi:hypothetical protein
VFISEKESEEMGKRGHFERGGEVTPSLLNVPPPKVKPKIALSAKDYQLKCA